MTLPGSSDYRHLIADHCKRVEECKTCAKDGAELENCIFEYPGIENGEIRGFMAKRCERQEQYYKLKRINKRMSFARIGAKHKDCSFANFSQNTGNAKAVASCVRFASRWPNHKGRGLLLYGSFGTGKTHLAIATMRNIIERGGVGVSVMSPELLDEIRKNQFAPDSKTEIMDEVKNVELLVLDDLGAEKPTEWVIERLMILINYRYVQELPTIITSNYSLAELADRIGSRTVSRLVEMCESVEITGEDYRRKKATEVERNEHFRT